MGMYILIFIPGSFQFSSKLTFLIDISSVPRRMDTKLMTYDGYMDDNASQPVHCRRKKNHITKITHSIYLILNHAGILIFVRIALIITR